MLDAKLIRLSIDCVRIMRALDKVDAEMVSGGESATGRPDFSLEAGAIDPFLNDEIVLQHGAVLMCKQQVVKRRKRTL